MGGKHGHRTIGNMWKRKKERSLIPGLWWQAPIQGTVQDSLGKTRCLKTGAFSSDQELRLTFLQGYCATPIAESQRPQRAHNLNLNLRVAAPKITKRKPTGCAPTVVSRQRTHACSGLGPGQAGPGCTLYEGALFVSCHLACLALQWQLSNLILIQRNGKISSRLH